MSNPYGVSTNYRNQVDVTLVYRQYKDTHEVEQCLDLPINGTVVDMLKDVFRQEFRISAPKELIDICVVTSYENLPVKTSADIHDNIQKPIQIFDIHEDYPTLRLQFFVREPIWKEGQGYWLNQKDYDKHQKKERLRRDAERSRLIRDAQIMEEQMEMREMIDEQRKMIEELRGEVEALKSRKETCGFCGEMLKERVCDGCAEFKIENGSTSSNESLVKFDEMEITEAVEEMTIEQ